MIFRYLKAHRFLYFLLATYVVALSLNALGIPVWLPSCPIYQITGHECFGCGTNRALIDLLSFKVHDAWQHNKLIFFYLPLFAFAAGRGFYLYFTIHKNSKQ